MKQKKIPPILNKGDKIGLITPAGFITKNKLETAVNNMIKINLKPVYFNSVIDKYGYLAGRDSDRLNELHKMYEDKSIKAILCVRGGYGTTRLYDKINYKLIKKNPKPLIGYSDITALLAAIYKETKLPGIHGIIGAKTFTEYTTKQFIDIFFGTNHEIVINNPISSNNYDTINPGIASGVLIGGNLSILCSLQGTRFDIDWSNKIVFIEETNEAPYKIDRMLTQLISAGKFKNVKGIIMGAFNKCDYNDFNIDKEDSLSLKEIIDEIIKPLNIPTVYGFSFGHIDDQAIFPFGIKIKFNADKPEITIKRELFKDFF